MEDRKLFPCSAYYNVYAKLISDVIKIMNINLPPVAKLKNRGAISAKGGGNFCVLR